MERITRSKITTAQIVDRGYAHGLSAGTHLALADRLDGIYDIVHAESEAVNLVNANASQANATYREAYVLGAIHGYQGGIIAD